LRLLIFILPQLSNSSQAITQLALAFASSYCCYGLFPGLGKNGPGKNGPGKNGPGKNGPEKTVRGVIGLVVESVKTVRSFR